MRRLTQAQLDCLEQIASENGRICPHHVDSQRSAEILYQMRLIEYVRVHPDFCDDNDYSAYALTSDGSSLLGKYRRGDLKVLARRKQRKLVDMATSRSGKVPNNSKTQEEIDDVLNTCAEALDSGSKFPGMSYEEGVEAAIRWLLDDGNPGHPFEE